MLCAPPKTSMVLSEDGFLGAFGLWPRKTGLILGNYTPEHPVWNFQFLGHRPTLRERFMHVNNCSWCQSIVHGPIRLNPAKAPGHLSLVNNIWELQEINYLVSIFWRGEGDDGRPIEGDRKWNEGIQMIISILKEIRGQQKTRWNCRRRS